MTVDSNFTNILLKLKDCYNINIINDSYSLWLFLGFKNATILVKSSKEDPIFINGYNFIGNLNVNNLSNFWFTKESSGGSQIKNETFLHIAYGEYLNLSSMYIGNLIESKALKKKFSTQLSKSQHDLEIIIPMSYLYSIEAGDCSKVSSILNDKFRSDFIQHLLKESRFLGKVGFKYYLENIDQFTSLFPTNCEYLFEGKYKFEDLVDKLNDQIVNVEKLLSIRISRIEECGQILSK